MRRFLSLLLALVLSLQMSWAAAHFCDDERLVAQAVAAAQLQGEHVHDSADEPESEQISDACCGAAHACHGLHHLAGQPAVVFAAVELIHVSAPAGVSPFTPEPASRIDRPNWLAA